jgi:acyl-CoA synthetase
MASSMNVVRMSGRTGVPLNRDPDRVSYLAVTSGSTGAPKGVMHSDNTLLAALRMMAADWLFGPNTVTHSLDQP